MSILDLIIAALVVGGVMLGYRRGLILEAASLIGVILAVVVAYQFSDDVAPVLRENVPLPESVGGEGLMGLLPVEKAVYSLLSFLLLFVGTRLAVALAARMLNSVARMPVLSGLNRIGGAVFGFLKVLLILMIVIHLLHWIPWSKGQQSVEESTLSQGILKMTPDLTDAFQTPDESP